MIFSAILHKENDIYVAQCAELGVASQGYTFDEAISNLREASELYLEEFPVQSFSSPIFTTFEAKVA